MSGRESELPLSPAVRTLAPYPFARLDALREAVEAKGIRVVDLSIGDIREITPEPIRRALVEAVPERSSYPRALGTRALREAAAGWVARRFGVALDPGVHVLPTNGSKEAAFTLHLAVVDPGRRPLVLLPDPAYPVYARGTAAAGGIAHPVPLLAENGFLPDLDAIPADVWRRASILWINYPNNPTGAVAPLEFLVAAAARCREHGVLLAGDEPYTEIYYGDPPPSVLQTGCDNVLALHTLSKRSALPGYRSGFMAGDARLIAALKKFRPAVGVATPGFIQAAAVAAWSDETHVAAFRETFRARRDRVVPALQKIGLPVGTAEATIYLWVRVPGEESSESFVGRALDEGVVLLPGSAMGERGEGFFRLSLTADGDDLDLAVERLARVTAASG